MLAFSELHVATHCTLVFWHSLPALIADPGSTTVSKTILSTPVPIGLADATLDESVFESDQLVVVSLALYLFLARLADVIDVVFKLAARLAHPLLAFEALLVVAHFPRMARIADSSCSGIVIRQDKFVPRTKIGALLAPLVITAFANRVV